MVAAAARRAFAEIVSSTNAAASPSHRRLEVLADVATAACSSATQEITLSFDDFVLIRLHWMAPEVGSADPPQTTETIG